MIVSFRDDWLRDFFVGDMRSKKIPSDLNKHWRLVFQWNGGRGEATGVYLDDHSYR